MYPQPRVYDAANQVVGGSYDAAGNLLSDGTRTLSYDALNRLTSAATGSTTTTTYRYGRERLAEVQGSLRTWYRTDALGSLRQTLTDSGTGSAPIHYDPWGTPMQSTPPTFGFTGQLQEDTSGLVHLRKYRVEPSLYVMSIRSGWIPPRRTLLGQSVH